ncbi:VOC family protein [Aliiroseovarius sp. KMU-50]|uniref:VOC family protein n=1 Tax=Aliiroseovarius salicola TaxID=3009082 RepID=A0ABT4W6K6_9RHOB|nr:VOC family protein [Aliiroseovarius sp. KMU-50]MDA5095537.1 VOC family protein [Aliiroseovarius sp. KMU-50]
MQSKVEVAMQPIPYLFFNGTCRDAMTYYGKVFGSAPEIMNFKDMPEDVRAGMPGVPDDAIMHAGLAVGDGWIYASDDPSDGPSAMAGSDVSLALSDEAETQRIWDALADGGEIRMPLSPMFWTPLFGTLTDRFGTRWMIMTDGPAPD